MRELQPLVVKVLRKARGTFRRLVKGSIYLEDKLPNQKIGKHSYGELCLVDWSPNDGKLRIGKYCSFGPEVKVFLGGEHRADWISTYPFNVLEPNFSHITGHPHSKGDVTVENDVWIGWGALIMSGVRVGNGAVVGAYSLVTKDVPDYAIVAGNPARLVRMRFPPEVIARLLEIQWWNWPHERVRRAIPYLQSGDMEGFLRSVSDGKL